jgi:hypothetical protein
MTAFEFYVGIGASIERGKVVHESILRGMYSMNAADSKQTDLLDLNAYRDCLRESEAEEHAAKLLEKAFSWIG